MTELYKATEDEVDQVRSFVGPLAIYMLSAPAGPRFKGLVMLVSEVLLQSTPAPGKTSQEVFEVFVESVRKTFEANLAAAESGETKQ